MAIGPFIKAIRARHWLALAGVVVASSIVVLWLTRRPLTEAAIAGYLADRGVEAAYTVAEADNRHLIFQNVAIGPVGNRDLTVRRIVVDLAWAGYGPNVTAVRLEAPVMRARVVAKGISFGSLDRLIPSTTSVRFPAISMVITDGTASIVTPFGPVTASVDAAGRLDTDFRAIIRTAPAALRSATCSGNVGAAQIILTTTLRDFVVSGAGPAEKIVCTSASVPQLQWAFHLAAPITMATASGEAMVQANAGRAGPLVFSGPSLLRLTGTGARGKLRGAWHASFTRLTAVREAADRFAGDGRFEWRQTVGIDIDGKLHIEDLASGTARTALLVAGLPSVAGELAKRLGVAARLVAVDAAFTAARGQRSQFAITSAQVRGANGALLQFIGKPGGRWSADAAAVDGAVTLVGGGLPSTRIDLSLHAPRNAVWSGSADLVVQPWRSGSAALAVPGIKVDIASGFAKLSGRAVVSTSFGNAQFDGLDVRLAVRSSLDGEHVVLGPSCVDVASMSVGTNALTLGRFAARLCPVLGAPPPSLSGNVVAGDIMVSAVRLQGRSSERAFVIETQPMRVSLGGSRDRPVVRSPVLALRLLSGDVAVNATVAGDMTGTHAGWTGSGHLSAVAADLPAIRLRRGAAQWQLAAGTLTLTGASAQLTDPNARPRFAPLQLINADASRTGDRITGHAAIRLIDGQAEIASVRGSYLTRTGTGSALLDSTLEFSKKLQPLQISELARGYVANVVGKVISHADLTVGPDGLHGTGTIQFKALSLATAALGPVTGVEGTLHFDDLPRLHTPPAQVLKIASINPGVLVENGIASFQIVNADEIMIEAMRWPFAGGTLALQPVTFRTGETQRRFTLVVDGLDAGQFLERFELKNLNATGQFDGVLPLVFTAKTGRIEGGQLTARHEGGVIQYVGNVGQDSMGAPARLAFDALRSMRYKSLVLKLDGDLDGELVTAISFSGNNLEAVKLGGALPLRSTGLPFKFGITVRAPFRALLGNVAAFSDARSLLLNAQSDPVVTPNP